MEFEGLGSGDNNLGVDDLKDDCAVVSSSDDGEEVSNGNQVAMDNLTENGIGYRDFAEDGVGSNEVERYTELIVQQAGNIEADKQSSIKKLELVEEAVDDTSRS